MRLLAPILLMSALCGCATITRGTTQNIAINTPGAPGAQCTLNSPSVGTKVVVTPATLVVQKGQDAITVRCTKECFQEGAGVVDSNMENMTAGNVLVGGVVGLGVDAMSGAMNKYNSDTNIVMTPIQGCRARNA